jgi:hypothetical protein
MFMYCIFAVQSALLCLGTALMIGYVFPETALTSVLTTTLRLAAITIGVIYILSKIGDFIVEQYEPGSLLVMGKFLFGTCGVMIAGIVLLLLMPAWQTSSDPQGMLCLAALIAFFTLYAPWMQQVGSQALTFS